MIMKNKTTSHVGLLFPTLFSKYVGFNTNIKSNKPAKNINIFIVFML